MALSTKNYTPLDTVKDVELHRYTGLWFEIATIPHSFEKDMHCVTAEYSLTKNGYITVVNSARKGGANGRFKYIKGKAFPDKKESGKLKVQFFWPFKGDYWIIELDKVNYSYAVVGHPTRNYLWILCREPQMEKYLYDRLVESARQKGFPVEKLRITDQRCYL